MDEEQDARDQGISVRGLWQASWVLGLTAGAAFLAFLLHTSNPPGQRFWLLVWVLVALVCTVWSAACAVIAAVKSAEARLAAPRPPD